MNMRAWSILLAAALIYIYIITYYASNAQVCEYARTWKRNPLVIKWMMF